MFGRSFVVDGARWWCRDGADPEATATRVRRALGRVAGAPAASLGKRLHRIALGDESGPDHLLKIWRPPLPRAWRGSKALRELQIAEALAARGVPVALPLAAGERRRAGLRVESLLLVPLLEDFVDLRAALGARLFDAGARRRLARALGALARRAHDAGLVLEDFTPTNLLVRRGDPSELRLVDFERARIGRPPGRRGRAWMLAKLARGLPQATARERRELLRGYSGDPGGCRTWWDRVERAGVGLALRDERRLARAARRDGRRFRAIAGELWSGVARRDVPASALAALDAFFPHWPRGTLRAHPDTWVVHYPGTPRRAARRLFARAEVLFERDLGPRPLALVRRGGGHLLLLQRGDERRAGDRDALALRRLRGSLLALGQLAAAFSPDAVAVRAPDGRALLLAPHLLRTGRRGRSASAIGIQSRRVPSDSDPGAMQKPEPTLPIFSTRADDPECLEAIERFVVSLAERVDHLQDAQARSQLCELSDQALRLGRDAEQLGFADLGSAAAEIEACCRAEDRTAALKALRALTDVAHRIRLGHRGAS